MSQTNLIGTYAAALPGIPGSSSKVFGIEADVRALRNALAQEEERILDLPRVAHSLTGATADSFASQHETMRRGWIELVDGVDEGARAINAYGWTLEDLERRAAQLEDQMLAYDAALAGLSTGERIEKILSGARDAATIRAAYLELIRRAKEASRDCAEELGRALDPDAIIEDRRALSASSSMTRLTAQDFERINQELAVPDYRAVRQGGIGDCHLVSVVQALMAGERGRRYIRSMMRPHYDAHGTQDGYAVTLHDTSAQSASSFEYDILVTEVHANGVQGPAGAGANVAGVLEAAVGQYHAGEEPSALGTAAGYASAIAGLLVGESRIVFAAAQDAQGRPEYTQDARQLIIASVRAGQCVTASMGRFGPGIGGGETIADVRIDGRPVAIELESMHSYAVLDATDSHLTLHNPWGENCPATGNTVLDGTFTIDWARFGHHAATTVLADCRL